MWAVELTGVLAQCEQATPQPYNPLQLLIFKPSTPWSSGETSISILPANQRPLRLGYRGGAPDAETLEQREQISALRAAKLTAVGIPAAHDWRNVGGYDYVTPIRNQGACGSSVSFGTTAAVEAKMRIERGNPGLAADLSEASLFFCIGPGSGASCSNGWHMTPAMDGYKNTGVPDEACFPYTDHQQACGQCSDWKSRATKIVGWHTISSVPHMKTWLSSNGPLATCFTVYHDFFTYAGGVYKHVTGGLAGGHCVCVVGYDDAVGCWICQNSWGTDWGESGFFRIAYGECGIDSTMWAVEGIVAIG
jgi:C1A family cysteine protease